MWHHSALRFDRTRAAVLWGAAALAVCLCVVPVQGQDEDTAAVQEAWRPPLKYTEKHFEALYPIAEYHDTTNASLLALRPIYSRRADKFNDVVEWDLFWPFVFGTGRPDLRRLVIFPLFVKDTLTTPGVGEVSRTVLLPFYYRKSTERKGVKEPGTFFIFPFGGVIRDFLGRDKISVVLWPLYVKQESATATSWSVLHPIFTYVRWKEGGRGYKFWPVYGINRNPGKMRSEFILWPFYVNQQGCNELGEFKRWWFWPFYGKIEEPGGWEWSVVWPFISGRYEKAADETSYWYPWPFLGHRKGPNREGRTFWPIYKSTRGPTRRDVNFLWPFGWYRREWPENADNVSFRILPLMFYQREKRYVGGASPGHRGRRLAGLAAGAAAVARRRFERRGDAVRVPVAELRALGAEFRAALPAVRVPARGGRHDKLGVPLAAGAHRQRAERKLHCRKAAV
jgi:hypothetical protein